jgi:nucleoside-diphosphate-sugar epimerase
MNTKPLVAITGSNGYVGGCLKQRFLERGWDVLELTRAPRPGTRGVAFQLGGDLPAGALAGVQALVHAAYDFKPLNWAELQAVNLQGTAKLFAAAKAAGVPRMVCISTLSAFPGCRSLYGRAKLEVEKLAAEQDALVVRPGLVYGNGPGGMFGKLTAQVRKSNVIPMIGDGSQIQYTVHEEDLAAFVEPFCAGKTNPPGRLYVSANPQPWTFKNLLQEIARGQGRRPKFVPLPWRFIWLGLKTAETLGVRLNFRSDSLVSLMYQNPAPDFSPNAAAGLVCRPLEVDKAKL